MLVVYGWRTNIKKEKQLGSEHCTNCSHDEERFLAKEIFKQELYYNKVNNF